MLFTLKHHDKLNFWPQLFKSWITLFTGQIAIQWISVDKTNHAIRWIVIYPEDSVIHLSNNPSQVGGPKTGGAYKWDSLKAAVYIDAF